MADGFVVFGRRRRAVLVIQIEILAGPTVQGDPEVGAQAHLTKPGLVYFGKTAGGGRLEIHAGTCTGRPVPSVIGQFFVALSQLAVAHGQPLGLLGQAFILGF